jgi:hypothetical protein
MIENLKVQLEDEGNINLWINDEFVALNNNQINSLIDILKCAQNDAKELLEIKKKRDSILKNYNSVGRHIKEEG